MAALADYPASLTRPSRSLRISFKPSHPLDTGTDPGPVPGRGLVLQTTDQCVPPVREPPARPAETAAVVAAASAAAPEHPRRQMAMPA